MKKIKVFLIILLSSFFGLSLFPHYSNAVSIEIRIGAGEGGSGGRIQSGILNGISDDVPDSIKGQTSLGKFFALVKKHILNFVFIIAIIMIVWIGMRMAAARGNPDEFKKAWLHFVYLIVGLFLVFTAWGIVKLVTSINIF
ncbi:hypothetical protein DLH72_02765 [Candidatus Gracilibacteria bacterium]|nr:MAG: hypothetical protein DLH72_02765 [Candidatus Gracilibacteria bacterium]